MTAPGTRVMKTNPLPTAIPLIVGVTGHRDLLPEDLQKLKELVREVFQTLKAKHPHTPLVLLSPLVEGADQLVAEVALEQDVGAQLLAVLCSRSIGHAIGTTRCRRRLANLSYCDPPNIRASSRIAACFGTVDCAISLS